MRYVLLLLCCALACSVNGAEPVDYLRDIKPVLAQKCFACHGALKQEAGLRLDAAFKIRAGGDSGPVIQPGDAAHSVLVKRVSATDVAVRMPPEGEGEPLDPRQLALLKNWIEQGAVAPEEALPPDPREHWAYQKPVRPALPAGRNAVAIQNPIDAFLAVQHEARQIAPLPAAAKNVLLRRVYLDLIGLPPTPEEQANFLTNDSPSAYADVVDALLERHEYGQRWGRHWMDVWRYSDWAGYKQEVRESQRHIWRWRDWIIESLNADKGYDQMVLEMLAGDEVAPGDRQALRATGFLVRNRHSSNRNIWLDAAVEHTAKAFLGLTINCARCHDHKFDPIPQVAYYEMRAIFEAHDVATERLPGQPDLVKEGFVRAFDGKPEAPTFVYIRGNEKQPDKDRPIRPGLPDVLGGKYEPAPVAIPHAARVPHLCKEFEAEDLAAARAALAKAEEAFDKAKAESMAKAAASEPLPRPAVLAGARAAVAEAELASLAARWQADFAQFAEPPSPDFESLAKAASAAERRLAVARAELALLQAEDAASAAKKAAKPDDAKTAAAVTKTEKDLKTAQENLDKARGALDKVDSTYTSIAKPYPAMSTGRRLALARWIVGRDNPLAARVAVNHIWLRHFGSPLVDNVFDFGLRSPRPTHAALLDWLACELMDHGWSMKHVHRLMVLSQAYQRDAGGGPDVPEQNLAADPDNQLYWRMNPRRLEAELVRDNLLYVGGALDTSCGGPDIDQGLGETSRRRSVYFRHAYEKQMKFLVLFDAANVNECYRRSESVIPQQALAVANSSLSFAQARLLAADLAKKAPEQLPGDFVRAAYTRILCRAPTAAELTECEAFLASQTQLLTDKTRLTAFSGGKKPAVEPAAEPAVRARENLIHVLLNHNDFVTIR